MGDVRLVAPRIRVIRDGQDPLEIQADNRDLVGWEQTRVKHKWPKFDEAPFKWLTYLAWSAARRSGALETGVTYERWEAEVLSVRDLSQEDTTVDDDLGRPTHAGPGPA
jgi:hypothetical protein